FGVDVSELASGLANAQAAVAEAAEGMRQSLASVQSAFGLVGEAVVGITAILAGGSAFKEMIASTVNLNVQSLELGKQFGVSATEASVYKVALAETFLTQDQLSGAGARITRTLNSNESAFKNLGVATRDSNGNFRSTGDIILVVNEKLMTFKEGPDRNVEATKNYGRGWQENAAILRFTRDAIDEARVHAEALNLTVSTQSEAATAAYRSSMVGLKAVFEGVYNTIGQALMPVLTSLGDWFRGIGPAAIAVTREALANIAFEFLFVREGIQDFDAYITAGMQDAAVEVGQFVVAVQNGFGIASDAVALAWDSIGGTIRVLIDSLLVMSEVAKRALLLDFSRAKAAWAAGSAGIVNEVNANFAKLKIDQSKLSIDWSTMKAAWKEGDDTIAATDAAFLKTVEKNRQDAAASIKAMDDNIFGQRTA